MITCGSDLSRGADAAVRLAVTLAGERAWPLRVLHAMEGPGLGPAGRAAVRAALEERVRSAGAPDLRSPCDVALADDDGGAVASLATEPERLVVVGSEGSSATLLRQAGHVPATLAASVPPRGLLMVAPAGWRGAPSRSVRASGRRRTRDAGAGATFERVAIACSLTGGDAARVAAAARFLGRTARAEIHLIHVVDVVSARELPPSARAELREHVERRTAEALERLRDLAADAPMEAVEAREPRLHVIAQGPVERDLAGLAASQAASLLVTGPGPTASRLVAFAPCPLLVAG